MDTPKRHVSWLESFPSDIWAYFVWYLPGEQLGRLMMTGATLLWQRLKSPGVVKSINLGEDYLIFKSFPAFLRELPSVDELMIHSCHRQWSDKLGITMESLPSGLRKLGLSGHWNGSTFKLFGEPGATLKLCDRVPHLEALDLGCVKLVDYAWMTHSPQSLTKLSIDRWDGTVELPTSLIHFEASIVSLSTSPFIFLLPSELETFFASELYGVDLLAPLLPPSTRKLRLGWTATCSNDPKSPQNLLEQLPKSLTWLHVPDLAELDFAKNPEFASLLSARLTQLHIAGSLPCSTWQLLPPHLTTLSFFAKESLCTVASSIVDRHGVEHEVTSVPFHYLPRSITMLELRGANIFCGPPAISQRSYFPPQLTELDLAHFQLAPEVAKLLPSSLTSLNIQHLCERVCEHLPNSLKRLSSSWALMTPNLIKFLPTNLISLHLTFPHSASQSWLDYNTGKEMEMAAKLADYSIHKRCISNFFDWKGSSRLPSTLCYLKLPLNAQTLGDTFLKHHLLPNLIEVNLRSSKYFSDLSIPLLSDYLTTLDLHHSQNVSGKAFKSLPRGLTSLDLGNSELIIDSDIKHLPRTLKRAILTKATRLTDLCVTDLRPHLEWLRVVQNSLISPSSFPSFPYTLRSADADRPVCAEFATWMIYQGVVEIYSR